MRSDRRDQDGPQDDRTAGDRQGAGRILAFFAALLIGVALLALFACAAPGAGPAGA